MGEQYKHIFSSNDDVQCISAEQMKLYVQNLLSPIEKRNVENHLLECEFCNDAVEGLKQSNFQEYNKALTTLNKEFRRRKRNTSRLKILYSPWKVTAVAASVCFLLIGTGIYFDLFLNIRFQKVAQNIESLSSQIGQLANLNKSEKKDTVTIFKETVTENNSLSQPTATDDLTPPIVNEEAEKLDSIEKSVAAAEDVTKDLSIENKPAETIAMVDAEDDGAAKMISKKPMVEKKAKAEANLNKEAISKTGATQTFATAPATISNISVSNFDKNASSSEKAEGINLLKNKNYIKAISILNAAAVKEQQNFEVKYYLGLSYYLSGNYIEAIKQFDFIMLSNNQQWYEIARYQKALAHLKINDVATAKNIFEQIISENGKYSPNAEKQLNELK
ncbi:MAG: Outer rane lipoprotein [Bacteroidota bacterium]|jgi:tetratricopeptide (TPR) repeat protein